ncbi:MAG TPA: hypothetical protein DDZ80_12215 [Cyanobacteria bacterium UBA8803]|nr:hypothetical protein [Cyanobacteria bacterium UBA9273]HBL59244.1 hypothetical protein [Cyanobacteria bacterium UBA8803]
MSEALLKNRDYTLILAKSPLENMPRSILPPDRWQAASDAMVALAAKCSEFDPDGITVYLMSDSVQKFEQVKASQIATIFQDFQATEPPKTSHLAAVLQVALDNYFERKAAGQTKENGEIMIVVTDKEPAERQAVVKAIVQATKKIDRNEELGIGLAQIGEHSMTEGFFKALDEDLDRAGARFDIVDTKILDTIHIDCLTQFLLDMIYD